MKTFTVFLILIGISTHAQSLKERIQGDWVCLKILDLGGLPTTGKYGESSDYLRFRFVKNRLTVSESPFDKGLSIPIAFKHSNSFECIPQVKRELPGKIYAVKELDKKNLILSASDEFGQLITYHFVNQKFFSCSTPDAVVDGGIIIIEHFTLSKAYPVIIRRVSDYRITNDSLYLSPSPIFAMHYVKDFGDAFSSRMRLPLGFNMDRASDELILEFDVDENGADNFRIRKKLSTGINSEVFRVMKSFRNAWKPVVIDDKPVRTTLRLHFYFYMTVGEIGSLLGDLPWVVEFE